MNFGPLMIDESKEHRPVVITIACSARFFQEARRMAGELAEAGLLVHLPQMSSFDKEAAGTAEWRPLVDRFLGKIRESDCLFVLAPGGYVGRAVAFEAGYAKARGCLVAASDAIDDGALQVCVDAVVSGGDLCAAFKSGRLRSRDDLARFLDPAVVLEWAVGAGHGVAVAGELPRPIVHDVPTPPTPPDEALSRLELENAELRRALAESPAAAELIRAAPGALRFRDAEHDALRRAIADAIPVIEAAIDFAENNFLGPDGVIDLKHQVIAAVRAFVGDGDRIEKMKAMLGSKP